GPGPDAGQALGGPDAAGPERVAALDPGLSGPAAFLRLLAEAHVHGAAVDWRPVFAGTGARLTDLPTYPFRHRRYWLAAAPATDGGAPAVPAGEQPLPGPAQPGPERAAELAGLALRDPAAARRAVLDELFAATAGLLGLGAEERAELRPAFERSRLNETGLDSLMAVRLREWLHTGLHADLPLGVLLSSGTAGEAADLVCAQLAARGLVTGGAEEGDGDAGLEVLTL
ncbi:phosphopantetheine-binding protein, partial [Streptomyces sp. YIM 98790]|uniref:phosphopantetheine-binding protein n=1 Tax=Streptomyces sp. YIM 98790 TaxID=2689077 RepID=UPI001FB6BB65